MSAHSCRTSRFSARLANNFSCSLSQWKHGKCPKHTSNGSRLTKFEGYLPACEYIPLSSLLANRDVSKSSLWQGGRRDGCIHRTSQKDKPEFDFVFKPSDIVVRGNVG